MAEKSPEKKPFYNVKVDKGYDYSKNNAGIGALAKSNTKMAAVQKSKAEQRAETLKKATAMVQKPKAKSKDEIKSTVKNMTKSPKPFYDVKAGKGYDYKKNNAGFAALAKSNTKMTAPQKPSAAKPTVAKPTVAKPATSSKGGSYKASKGDSLYSIAEKTVPKGKSVSSWFNAIKKMNAGRKIFTGTGVSIPKGSGK